MFTEDFEAWVYGAVIPSIYKYHRKKETVSFHDFPKKSISLTPFQEELITCILDNYTSKSTVYLNDYISHSPPYLVARKKLKPLDKGTNKNKIIFIE